MNIILAGVTFVLLGATVSSAQLVKGKLTVSGVTCTYIEKKPTNGPGPRGIRICGCKNNQGKAMGKECTYYPNNPHKCGKYNKNQPAYYKALAQSAMENGAPCAKSRISETICDLEYPCELGDCLGGRRRRDVHSNACPVVLEDDGSPNCSTVNKGIISVYVSVLVTFMFKSSL